MSKKLARRINGGAAIYYGFSCTVAAIAGFFGTGYWLYKAYYGEKEFSWGTLVGLVVIILVAGAIGYALLRVGYEEIEK